MLGRGVAVVACVFICFGGVSCAASQAEIRTARSATYQLDFATVYEQTRIAVVKLYPDVVDDSERGLIRTSWQQVDSDGPRVGDSSTLGPSARKRFFVRFRVEVVGSNPWQIRVKGEASEWVPGFVPMPLKKAEEPHWLQGRTDALQLAIHRRLKKQTGSAQPPIVRAEPRAPDEPSSPAKSGAQVEMATVHVRATAPGIAVAARTPGGDIVAPDQTTWKKVCVAPCTFKLEPGNQEVMIGGHGIPTKRVLVLEPGGSAYLVAKPRSAILGNGGAILALAGLTGILVGTGAMALTDLDLKWTIGTVMGGVGGLGIGVGLVALSDSSLEVESAPKGNHVVNEVSLSGQF